MAREAGAKKVFFSSCAPPITNAHIYGIDLASPEELIAHNRDSAAIAQAIGAEAVVYQSLSDLEQSCAQDSPRDPKTQRFEVGVFCGKYVTPVGEEYFQHMEQMRGEAKKLKVLDGARQAVRFGVAGAEQVRMAANGVDVTEQGEVVAAGADPTRPNGVHSVGAANAPPIVRGDSQDISMHNFNDYGAA